MPKQMSAALRKAFGTLPRAGQELLGSAVRGVKLPGTLITSQYRGRAE